MASRRTRSISFPRFTRVGAARLIPGLLAPLFARENRRAIWALWACFVSCALFWFFLSQVDRYLAPAFGVGIFLAALCLYELARFLLAAYVR